MPTGVKVALKGCLGASECLNGSCDMTLLAVVESDPGDAIVGAKEGVRICGVVEAVAVIESVANEFGVGGRCGGGSLQSGGRGR